ncbi:hypothetical protein [Staphylococcus epidermidis]|nr:hypothetical protein [Staphylococcus epidermidis]
MNSVGELEKKGELGGGELERMSWEVESYGGCIGISEEGLDD